MAGIVSNTLYDESEQAIYPVTHAQFVNSNAINGAGQSVFNDLQYLDRRVTQALNLATGTEQIQNQLGIIVKYTRNNSLTAPNNDDNSWGEQFALPSSEFPYSWKKTTYTWDTNEVITTKEIVSTALFPETQVMYTVLNSPPESATGLGGPPVYTTEEEGSRDQNAQNVTWKYYFPGISASAIYGYMAVRHREAGQPFPEDENHNPVWKITLFAQYPIINSNNNE